MIYVFGATGYIGRYLCASLKEQGRDFVALGRSAKIKAFFDNCKIPFQHFDFDCTANWRSAIQPKPGDVFVNLAACLAEHETPVSDFFKVNTLGTYELLNFASHCGVKKCIVTSSHKVYNDLCGYEGRPIPEDVRLCYRGDHTPYIISKIAAENFVEYYNKDFGMQGICLRLTGVHGYGEILGHLNQDGSYSKSTFEIFFEKALRGDTIEVWGDQRIKRDHIYIKDVVSAIETAIDNDSARGIFNIASGKAYSQLEEACILAKVFATDKVSEVVSRPDKPGLTRGYLYDISKAEKELHWHPAFADMEKLYRDYKVEWKSKKFHNYHIINENERPLTF